MDTKNGLIKTDTLGCGRQAPAFAPRLDPCPSFAPFPAPPVSSRASLRGAAIVGPAAQSRPFG